MLQELIDNWEEYCIDANFIGIGSTRKAYRVNDYVIKRNLHRIGYNQSQQELLIYQLMVDRGKSDLFAEVYFVDENVSIQQYITPLELKDGQSYEINIKEHASFIPRNYEEILHVLDTEFDSFDLKDSSNYGLNPNNKLIFIDYGMTKKLYENEWVPLAEAGILPQIDFDDCSVCGEKKELRMYGEDDQDKRCFACGKE